MFKNSLILALARFRRYVWLLAQFRRFSAFFSFFCISLPIFDKKQSFRFFLLLGYLLPSFDKKKSHFFFF
jgi:hypothetical protein